jgi:glycerol-3-phosphate dehydrogenase
MTPPPRQAASDSSDGVYDVAVIGAGLVGSAIARQLAGHELSVALLERRSDVGDGTSKANTALLHTGYDTIPGSLESRLVRRGYQLLGEYAGQTGIPIERTGALLVAWDDEQLGALPGLKHKAEQNGSERCEIIDAAAVYRQLPNLGRGARGAMLIPDESITCTWTTSLALAIDARRRGVELLLDHAVEHVEVDRRRTVLQTSGGTIEARFVVNAAGLRADLVDELFGHRRFTVTPRRGELLVFDKLSRSLVDRIVLAVPTRLGKGVLISPTIYGNVMLGPTAEDLDDKNATGTSEAGIAFLLDKGRTLMPQLLQQEVTAMYAGLRATIDGDDYLIDTDRAQRYVLVAGIRSTGLTASMAIGEYVRDQLAGAGLELTPRSSLPPPPRMPNLGEHFPRPYQQAEQIAGDSEYGRIVCFCERVTAGEILDAYASPIPPRDLGGVRRRTRAMNGRCQGFFCGAEVLALAESGPARRGPRSRGAAPADPDESVEVLIIGGGPSGLTAAAQLAPRITGRVLVVEREATAGGIPRHSDHIGYGIRNLRRVMSGPAYARRLTDDALRAGAEIWTRAMVTGWAGERSVELTSPRGRRRIDARAIVLATGARERARAARLVPGDRPAGVYTTGQLQNLVHLHHRSPGTRAVIVGAELVSWSAVLTLREAGCQPVTMVSAQATAESPAPLRIAGRLALNVPVATRTRVTRISGHGRVSGVELEDLDTGARRPVACDCVVFTGDWIPDNELAQSAGLEIDPGSHGPVVDTRLATSIAGVFAIGNLTHPVDTADIAALDGRAVADHVLAHLRRPGAARPPSAAIVSGRQLKWIAPGALSSRSGPPGERLLSWPTDHITLPVVTVHQDGRRLARRRLPWSASPGRAFRIPASTLARADVAGGPITIDLD